MQSTDQKKSPKDSLLLPIAFSIVWLLIGLGVVASRAQDFWALPLNAMGDTLAGVFAPLAFLWLFVATSLQRRELRLQREELAETRQVLSEQREELERAAEESNRQTSIMQRTLDAANSRDVYDEFRLRLYYAAKFVSDYYPQRILYTLDERKVDLNANTDEPWDDGVEGHYLFTASFKLTVSENDSTSVDRVFHTMQENLGVQFEVRKDKLAGDEDYQLDNYKFLHFVTRIIYDLQSLLANERYKSVPLIVARMDALEIELLVQRLEGIRSELAAALGPDWAVSEQLKNRPTL